MFSSQVQRLPQLQARQEELLNQIADLLRFARSFKDQNGARPFHAMPVEGQPYTLMEAILLAERVLRAFRRIKLVSSTPVPSGTFEQIVSQTEVLGGTINELTSQFEALANYALPLAAISGSRLQAAHDGQIIADITDMTNRHVSAADKMLEAVNYLAGVANFSSKTPDEATQSVVTDDLSEVVVALTQAEAAAEEVRSLLEGVTQAHQRAGELLANLDAMVAEVTAATDQHLEILTDAVAEAKDTSTQISNDAAVSSAKKEEVDRLNAQTQDAFKDIAAFATTLDSTKKRIDQAQSRAGVVVAEYEKRRSDISEMIAQAERMVSGSTVAGLASAFDQERISLDRGLKSAFTWFVVGIILLFLTSVALAAYVTSIPILGLPWLIKEGTAEPTLAGVISRAIIVIAPFWLTLFSSRRYRSIFDLKQQYSHKYNMAFSMEGFKNQAPAFKEQIAAWVFTIVAASPTLPKSGSPMDTPPPTSLHGMMTEVRAIYDRVMGKE